MYTNTDSLSLSLLLYGGLKRSKEKGPASRFLGMKEDERLLL
jgi:hypothetical protein